MLKSLDKKKKKTIKNPARKPTIFPHTVLVNWNMMSFCRGRGQRDRFSYQHLKHTPALLRNRLTALSSLQSPLGATNQPHCCVTLSSRCEKPLATQCQNMPLTKSHPGSSSSSSNSDKKAAKCIDKVCLQQMDFSLQQRLNKVTLNGRASSKLAPLKRSENVKMHKSCPPLQAQGHGGMKGHARTQIRGTAKACPRLSSAFGGAVAVSHAQVKISREEKSIHRSAVEVERVSRTPYCCSHDLFKGFGML